MPNRQKRIRQLAEELLAENKIKSAPVPVEEIIKRQGLFLRKETNPGSELSGFIARRGSITVIGVNSTHPVVRQRFTMAHELGHHLLHPQGPNEVHADHAFQFRFRDGVSSQGIDSDEIEANLFAAELLMPQKFIEADLQDAGEIDLADDQMDVFIEELAKKYQVSVQAMMIRFGSLGYTIV